MKRLPLEVAQLAERMKTHGALTHPHESHSLKSLATRLLLSKGETLDHICAGRLLPIGQSGKHTYLFPTERLDKIRNRTVGFIAEQICIELERSGLDHDIMLSACSRAFSRQLDLARGREAVTEMARNDNDDDSFVGNAKRAAGTAAGVAGAGAAGYGLYRGYQSLRKSGTPRLPGAPVSVASSDNGDHDLLTAAIKRGRSAVGAIGGALRGALKFVP